MSMVAAGAAKRAGEALEAARRRLRAAGIAGAGLDARLLLGAVLGIDTAALIARPERPLDAGEAALFQSHVARRIAGEPVARILGEKEFWGLSLRLGAATLVPRPETEILVETVLDEIRRLNLGSAITICDLGTGSGAILIALLSELPEAAGFGIDLSDEAVRIAGDNARRTGVAARARFEVADFAEFRSGRFDVIVANPPYVATGDISGLGREVKDHDPQLALDGGPDGLDAYRAIAARASDLLRPGGLLAVEVGASQAQAVATMFGAGGMTLRRIASDLSGIPRVVAVLSGPGSPGGPGSGECKKSLGNPRRPG